MRTLREFACFVQPKSSLQQRRRKNDRAYHQTKGSLCCVFDSIGERLYVQKSGAMTQCVARSIIEIANIRVEPLQDISLGDVRREGLQGYSGPSHAFQLFATTWDCLYPSHPIKGWDANPWVWVYGFKRVENGK